jgi:hypothetical protein
MLYCLERKKNDEYLCITSHFLFIIALKKKEKINGGYALISNDADRHPSDILIYKRFFFLSLSSAIDKYTSMKNMRDCDLW